MGGNCDFSCAKVCFFCSFPNFFNDMKNILVSFILEIVASTSL